MRVLAVQELATAFPTRAGLHRAITGVSFEINQGETLGLVGEAGSGKTVLTHSLLNAVKRPGRIVHGSVYYQDTNLLTSTPDSLRHIRGREIAIIVSNPRSALNPLLTVGVQIANAYRSHRSGSQGEAGEAAVEALRSVGINDPERRSMAYPHELSGGMAQRVVIAIALLHTPNLLIADEPTAGLDVTIQRQILEMIRDLIQTRKMTTLFATRNLGIIAEYCQRVGILKAGQLVEIGPTETIFRTSYHPYTHRLLRVARLNRVDVGSDHGWGNGTKSFRHHFCQVCERAEACEESSLLEVSPGHWLRFHG